MLIEELAKEDCGSVLEVNCASEEKRMSNKFSNAPTVGQAGRTTDPLAHRAGKYRADLQDQVNKAWIPSGTRDEDTVKLLPYRNFKKEYRHNWRVLEVNLEGFSDQKYISTASVHRDV